MLPVFSSFLLKDIDIVAIASSKGFKQDCSTLMEDNVKSIVFDYITDELDSIGGQALVEVDDTSCTCVWIPPLALNDEERVRHTYMTHMIQSGILRDPSKLIANTVYGGNGIALAHSLLMINASGCNKYVAERDLYLLASAAPLYSAIWLVLGLMLLSNGNFERAKKILSHLMLIEADDLIGNEYMAILHTIDEPMKALTHIEKVFNVLSVEGKTPDIHNRVTYGFVLKSLGMNEEAGRQFFIVCGSAVPTMTLEQWTKWGFSLPLNILGEALMSPEVYKDSFSYTFWGL